MLVFVYLSTALLKQRAKQNKSHLSIRNLGHVNTEVILAQFVIPGNTNIVLASCCNARYANVCLSLPMVGQARIILALAHVLVCQAEAVMCPLF